MFRRLGISVLVVGTFGLVLAAARWWLESEGGALRWALDSYEWLRIGAACLKWGAIVFLSLTTLASILEFVKPVRVTPDASAAILDE